MIKRVYVIHSEWDYFGSKHEVTSELNLIDEERVIKAVDKFFRRGMHGDVMHICTDDRHYVVSFYGGAPRWFAYYGPQDNKTAEESVTAAQVRKMVRENF